jgi:hypothetical protein
MWMSSNETVTIIMYHNVISDVGIITYMKYYQKNQHISSIMHGSVLWLYQMESAMNRK